MSSERNLVNDQGTRAGSSGDPTGSSAGHDVRFFLAAEPVATEATPTEPSASVSTDTPSGERAFHSFRVSWAPFAAGHEDLLSGRPVVAVPGAFVPVLRFSADGLDAESPEFGAVEDFFEYVSAETVACGPDGLWLAAEAALVRIEAEAEELEWRRRVVASLLAGGTPGTDWTGR